MRCRSSSSLNSISILFLPRVERTFTFVLNTCRKTRAAFLYDCGVTGRGARGASPTENSGARFSVARTDKPSATTFSANLMRASSNGTARIARACPAVNFPHTSSAEQPLADSRSLREFVIADRDLDTAFDNAPASSHWP